MHRTYTIRLYPNKDQEQLMFKSEGCKRFIHNYVLDVQNERFKNGLSHLSHYDTCKIITELKKDPKYDWLKEVQVYTLQIQLKFLEQGFKRFFNRIANPPKFKKKGKGPISFPITTEKKFLYYDEATNTVQISKFGRVKCKSDLNLNELFGHKITNARIYRVPNKWLMDISIDIENHQIDIANLSGVMGIDLGINKLATCYIDNYSLVFANINKTPEVIKLERKLKHLQRAISRKYEVGNKLHLDKKWQKTNAIIKLENLVRKIYYRLRCIRENQRHQITRQIVNLNPKTIVIEDLNIQGMMKNKHLSKSIFDVGFSYFDQKLMYKCEEKGIKVVKADRFFPSSKTCSNCGTIKKDLRLKDRTFICPECGLTIDRDLNAAINLSQYIE